jgi:hypothetical protein
MAELVLLWVAWILDTSSRPRCWVIMMLSGLVGSNARRSGTTSYRGVTAVVTLILPFCLFLRSSRIRLNAGVHLVQYVGLMGTIGSAILHLFRLGLHPWVKHIGNIAVMGSESLGSRASILAFAVCFIQSACSGSTCACYSCIAAVVVILGVLVFFLLVLLGLLGTEQGMLRSSFVRLRRLFFLVCLLLRLLVSIKTMLFSRACRLLCRCNVVIVMLVSFIKTSSRSSSTSDKRSITSVVVLWGWLLLSRRGVRALRERLALREGLILGDGLLTMGIRFDVVIMTFVSVVKNSGCGGSTSD